MKVLEDTQIYTSLNTIKYKIRYILEKENNSNQYAISEVYCKT